MSAASRYEARAEILVDARTRLPAPQYRWLVELTKQHNTSVESLLAELVRRAYTGQQGPSEPPPRVQKGLTPDRERIVREMHAAGKSDTAISRVLGCSPSTAGDYRYQLGLPTLFPGRRRKDRTEETS